jgi:hypothetical protein
MNVAAHANVMARQVIRRGRWPFLAASTARAIVSELKISTSVLMPASTLLSALPCCSKSIGHPERMTM